MKNILHLSCVLKHSAGYFDQFQMVFDKHFETALFMVKHDQICAKMSSID